MSDISINNSITQSNNISASQNSPKPNNITNKTPVTKESAPKPNEVDAKTKEFGPIVSTSSDGDTVRVKENTVQGKSMPKDIDESISEDEYSVQNFETSESDSALESYEYEPIDITYSETAKPIEYEPVEVETAEAEAAQNLTSYVGISDSDLKLMYLKGEISQQDYTLEIESRKEIREATSLNSEKFANSIANDITSMAEANRTEATVKAIENGNTSDTIPLDMRLKAIEIEG